MAGKKMVFEGKIWKFGANVNTDEIIPAPYLDTTDPRELGKHCMEGIDPDFSSKARPGDIILAGGNFGCGSSREHAPLAIKGMGIAAVIAAGFARIFYRNAINTGLPILECAALAEAAKEGERIRVDLGKGEITNLEDGKTYAAQPFPAFMQDLIAAGGLMNYTRARSSR